MWHLTSKLPVYVISHCPKHLLFPVHAIFLVYTSIVSQGPFTRYAKLGVAHAPGMLGTFSPPPQVSDPDTHHGPCVMHVPWCTPGSLISGFLWSRWWGKRSRHCPRMRNPQFCVSGKRPMCTCWLMTFLTADSCTPMEYVCGYTWHWTKPNWKGLIWTHFLPIYHICQLFGTTCVEQVWRLHIVVCLTYYATKCMVGIKDVNKMVWKVYLTIMIKYVKLNLVKSIPAICGMPQGAILGPLWM